MRPSHIFSTDCNMSLKRYARAGSRFSSEELPGTNSFLTEEEVDRFADMGKQRAPRGVGGVSIQLPGF
jgi:hypothetical protein